jgi:thiol peroxidase
MTTLTLKGKPVHTAGSPPLPRQKAPPFRLVDKDLKDRTLDEFRGKKKLLATAPSLDTGTCSLMTKKLNDFAKAHPAAVILVVTADLPFAQGRFCEAEHVKNVLTLSMMRDKSFGTDYGLLLTDGPIAGILARSLFVLDEENRVLYAEVVPEITHEPNYQLAFDQLVTPRT